MKRRKDLETNDISCIWLEIIQDKGKSFLLGNMYRPPDSKIEYNDRVEEFIDVSKEGKEIILLEDVNKNSLDDNADIYRMAESYFISRINADSISTNSCNS